MYYYYLANLQYKRDKLCENGVMKCFECSVWGFISGVGCFRHNAMKHLLLSIYLN